MATNSAAFHKFILTWLVLMAPTIPNSDGKCGKCAFKAIFNFGDSNSDTGGHFAAFPHQYPPYGMTYFKRPVGRASDGRLYIDFLAQALGLPFLSPYLQSIESNYKHGVNFAVGGSTVLHGSPFRLEIQLNQMKEFKTKIDELYYSSSRFFNLPKPDIFGKSLYTIYIGQNDFISALVAGGRGGVKQHLLEVISKISSAIKDLYALGGHNFLVLNLAPIGCYPDYVKERPHQSSDVDAFGCLISYNNIVNEYNGMLKEALSQTRGDLDPNSNLVYVDTHSVLLELFRHPKSHGLKYGTKSCRQSGGSTHNITYTTCKDPYNYVIWDGKHCTEAANKLLVLSILNGSLFDPPFSIHEHCDIHHIG